jgi:hypothetical protein
METSLTYAVDLELLRHHDIDSVGKYTGPVPAPNAIIDVLCPSRRIRPARVAHIDPERFAIRAIEVELV